MTAPWILLGSRELLFVAMVFAIGLGPASFLDEEISLVAVFTLAPVLGMCLATCVSTDLVWNFTAMSTDWLLPILAGISFVIGLARLRPRLRNVPPHLPRRLAVLLLQLLAIAVVVVGPTSYTLLERNSIGPVAYQVADSGAYTMETDGMLHESMRSAAALSAGPWSDLVQAFWTGYSYSNLEMSIDPFSANVDALIGVGATGTQAAFLLGALFVGALGIYGSLVYLLHRRSWVAVLGGAMFGGAFFLQLFFDGSEAAITGLAILVPLVVMGYEVLQKPRLGNLVLFALLVAGSLALYPLFVPMEALTGAIVVSCAAFSHVRKAGRLGSLLPGAARIAVVVVVAGVISPVAGFRDLRYLSTASSYVHGQPDYSLPSATLASWLVQARGFYNLTFADHSALSNVILGFACPVFVVVMCAVAFRRRSFALILATGIVVSVLIAIYDRIHVHNGNLGCTYCEERSLLPIAPLLIVLLCLGLGLLAMSARRPIRGLAVVFGLGVIGMASTAVVHERELFSQSYFLPVSVGEALGHLPPRSTVELEGFDEAAPNPTAELMLTYARADEQTWKHVSIPADFDENNSLLYFGNLGEARLQLPNPQFHAGYQFVLTRIAGVHTDRDVLFRSGPIALEKRVQGIDVLLDYGMSVSLPVFQPSLDQPIPNMWVNERMQFVVTGSRQSPSYVRLWFDLPSWLYTTRVAARHVVHIWRGPHRISVCLKTVGAPNAQVVDLHFPAGTGPRLTRMAAGQTRCPT